MRIVDGGICRTCSGEGAVQLREADGWAPCPNCHATGYDPDLRHPAVGTPLPRPPVVEPRPHTALAPQPRVADWDELLRGYNERALRRPPGQRRRAMVFAAQAVAAMLIGAAVGTVVVFPMLPAALAQDIEAVVMRVVLGVW